MNQKTPTKQVDIAADIFVIKERKEIPDAIAHSAMLSMKHSSVVA